MSEQTRLDRTIQPNFQMDPQVKIVHTLVQRLGEKVGFDLIFMGT